MSPELLDITFGNLLTALRTSSDLSLPLNPPVSFEEKTTAGRLETSSRALEVAEMQYCSGTDQTDEVRLRGGQFAGAFVEILATLNEGVVNSTAILSSKSGSTVGQIWEDGLRKVLAIWTDRKPSLRCSL